MDKLRFFVASVLAGAMIGIGGYVKLATADPVAGSALFSLGLLLIVATGLPLYTGAIGYAGEPEQNSVGKLALMLLGNTVGAALLGLMTAAMAPEALKETAIQAAQIRYTAGLGAFFLKGVLCGVLIYMGVRTYKTASMELVRVLALCLCVTVFVASGFEHCIADAFYWAFGHIASGWSFTGNTALYFAVTVLGNSVGSILVHRGIKFAQRKRA